MDNGRSRIMTHDTDDGTDSGATAADYVESRIRQDIVSGKLLPGQRLRLHDLRAMYGAGVGTLREALLRLEGDSLVESVSRRGFRVASVSVTDLIDIFESLKLIEVEALGRSMVNGDDQWEANILASHHRMIRLENREASTDLAASAGWEQHHIAFHQALIAASGSPLMLKFCNNLRQLALRYRMLLGAPPVQHPQLTVHHAPLVHAAMDRQIDKASAILTEHFNSAQRLLLDEWAGKSRDWPDRPTVVVAGQRHARA